MVANEMQIGGDHYKRDYQHWDWCIDINLSYLEGNATKYICRWREKGGIKDLNKASHYLTKALEAFLETRYLNHSWHNTSTPRMRNGAQHHTNNFIMGLNVSHKEQAILLGIAAWRTETDLISVIELLNDFIKENIKEPRKPSIEHPAPFGYDGEE